MILLRTFPSHIKLGSMGLVPKEPCGCSKSLGFLTSSRLTNDKRVPYSPRRSSRRFIPWASLRPSPSPGLARSLSCSPRAVSLRSISRTIFLRAKRLCQSAGRMAKKARLAARLRGGCDTHTSFTTARPALWLQSTCISFSMVCLDGGGIGLDSAVF